MSYYINRCRRSVRALLRISRTHYPGFVFGLPLRGADIPVFTYHDVEPEEFSGDLDFLARNGYRTLALEEYIAAGRTAAQRCVLLTFDDARRSFYTVALPLLREFGARATLFVPSYWMAGSAGNTISPPASQDKFMSWSELRDCVASGLVDVQSHAHRHALVFTSGRLVDFATPANLARFDIYDWPMRCGAGGEELGPPEAGTPIYEADPLLSASRRYLENRELAELCRAQVRDSSGRFFDQPGALKQLVAVHAQHALRLQGRFADDDELNALVRSEFERGREEFQRQLGYAPRYLAYPWMLGTRRSLDMAKQAGIEAVFGVAVDYRAARDSRLPIPVFGRLKCDWLRFLPGASRASVWGALGRKLRGFGQTQHLAH
jgi:peptidoglycan/xylan/chitin deacetylase (PgdA/CDA1 family)